MASSSTPSPHASPALDPSRLWKIHGRYYDLEPFYAEHPGGRRLLEQARGTDCTALFETTHLHDRVPRAMLARFHVGDDPAWIARYSWLPDGFYATVKGRVRDHALASAKARGLDAAAARQGHHGTPAFIARLFALWAIWGVLGVGAIGFGLWWCALPWGLFSFALGGYGHEAMHAGVFRSVAANRVLALLTLDLQGLSSFSFTATHAIHHADTNVAGVDPDIEVHYPLVRERPEQAARWFHRLQPVYAWVLYAITLPVLWVADVVAIVTGVWFGPYGRIQRPSAREAALFAFFKVVSLAVFYVLPFLLHPWPLALAIVALMMGGAGLAVSTTFALNHQNERAMGLEIPASGSVDWGARQVETTVDFHHGGWLPTTFTAGLGYQLEHHLFPTMSYSRLPEIAPIVRATCAEFGLPYAPYPTVLHALAAHLRFLRRMSVA